MNHDPKDAERPSPPPAEAGRSGSQPADRPAAKRQSEIPTRTAGPKAGPRATFQDEPETVVGAPSSGPVEPPRLGGRYLSGARLGRGGMGTVVLHHDILIGRDVALKTLHPGAPSGMRERFVREARIQGQLEHPAVVPVYDVGSLPDGTPFFTMKRVSGLTLSQLLEALRTKEDPEVVARYTLRKRLTDFVAACRALELAHARGVVHRDLKPSNIMLGDFGEVYILDWGIARVEARIVSPDEPDDSQEPPSQPWRAALGDTPLLVDRGRTIDGVILGTPGYMAPEQLQGKADVDARADIYSLGVILFELLTLEPFHEGFNLPSMVQSTMFGPDEITARLQKAPNEVGPELRAICSRATDPEREERYASVGQMVLDIERYLDGDRDMEHRRELAKTHADKAKVVARKVARGFETGDVERREAVLDATRALSLDPDHIGALRSLMALLLARPREIPPEVTEALENEDVRTLQLQARLAMGVFGVWSLLIPLSIILGARNVPLLCTVGASILLQIGLAWYITRNRRHHALCVLVGSIANFAGLLVVSRFISPWVLMPALTMCTTLIYVLSPATRKPALITGIGALALLGSFALEITGLFPSTYTFTEHAVVITPFFDRVRPGLLEACFLVTLLTVLALSSNVVANMRKQLAEARLQLHLNAWQLRQIVPEGAHPLLGGVRRPETPAASAAVLDDSRPD